MHIERCGSGPALVLLHGWAMHGGIFAALARRLVEHFTVHLVDLPGHGRSAHSEIALALEPVAREIAARVPPALWLGWSLGGLVALHAAQSQPQSVRGLIMLCASPRFVRAPDWPPGMDASVFQTFAGELGRDYRGTIDRFLLLEAQGSDHRREELALLRAQVFAHGQPTPRCLAQGLALLQDSDLRAGLPALPMPNLWLAGRRDRLVSPQAMRAAATQTPHSQFRQVEHGGHAPFLTQGEQIAAAIVHFSESLSA